MVKVTLEERPRKAHPGRVLIYILLAIVFTMLSAGIATRVVAGDLQTVPLLSQAGQSQFTVSAKQSLTVIGGSVGSSGEGRVFVDRDGTSFSAPTRVYQGDRFTVKLALGNSSQSPLDAQIKLGVPDGMFLGVGSRDGASGLVQTGTDKWAFTLAAGESDNEPDLIVSVRVSNVSPGSYNLKCIIEPLKF